MSGDELSKTQLLEVQRLLKEEFSEFKKDLKEIAKSNKEAIYKVHQKIDDSNTFMNEVNNKVASLESKNMMVASVFGSIAAVSMSWLLKR